MIIAILAAMLLPALNNARVAASRTNCINNCRQIGSLTNLYQGDYQDWYPFAYGNHYSKYLYPYLVPGKTWGTYTVTEKVFWCREGMGHLGDGVALGTKFPASAVASYGMNSNIFWTGQTRPSLIKQPSRFMLITDGSAPDGGVVNETVGYNRINPNFSNTSQGVISFRHKRVVPLLYGDMHVDTRNSANIRSLITATMHPWAGAKFVGSSGAIVEKACEKCAAGLPCEW